MPLDERRGSRQLALPTSTYSTAQIVDELLVMRDRFKAAAR